MWNGSAGTETAIKVPASSNQREKAYGMDCKDGTPARPGASRRRDGTMGANVATRQMGPNNLTPTCK